MLARRCPRLMSSHAGSSTHARAFSSSPTILRYAKSDRNLRNEEISLPVVHRVDPETTRLLPPESLSAILAGIDRSTHYVELVQRDPPVVKIVNSKEAHASRKAFKAKLKAAKKEQKEVQMTWNVGVTDLAHKLRKVREQLERGNMVDVAFAPKSKQPVPTEREMRDRMQQVVDLMQDIAEEKQERTLERGVGIIYLRLDKSKMEKA